MFSELDRTGIRWALGYSAIFLQADPSLENAITAVQSVSDGGSRPDSNGENFCKGIIYGFAASTGTAGVTPGPAPQNTTFSFPSRRGLLTLWSTIDQLDVFMGATSVDSGEAVVDSVRERRRLIAEGKRLVHALAAHLSSAIITDIFEPLDVELEGNTYHYNRPVTAWSGYYALRGAGARGLW